MTTTSSTKTRRTPWFKMNMGKFLQTTEGMSHEYVGLYTKLNCIIHILGDSALEDREMLKIRLGINSKKGDQILDELLSVPPMWVLK